MNIDNTVLRDSETAFHPPNIWWCEEYTTVDTNHSWGEATPSAGRPPSRHGGRHQYPRSEAAEKTWHGPQKSLRPARRSGKRKKSCGCTLPLTPTERVLVNLHYYHAGHGGCEEEDGGWRDRPPTSVRSWAPFSFPSASCFRRFSSKTRHRVSNAENETIGSLLDGRDGRPAFRWKLEGGTTIILGLAFDPNWMQLADANATVISARLLLRCRWIRKGMWFQGASY